MKTQHERQKNYAKINKYECNQGIMFSLNVSLSHAHFFTFTNKFYYPKVMTLQK